MKLDMHLSQFLRYRKALMSLEYDTSRGVSAKLVHCNTVQASEKQAPQPNPDNTSALVKSWQLESSL